MVKNLKNNPEKIWAIQLAVVNPLVLISWILPPAKTPLGHAIGFLLFVGMVVWTVYASYKLQHYLKAAKKSKEQAK